jgi:hypothetical protein
MLLAMVQDWLARRGIHYSSGDSAQLASALQNRRKLFFPKQSSEFATHS